MTPEQFEAMKRNIEAQLAEYAQELNDFAAFMDDWRRRHPQPQPAEEPAE